MKPKKLISILIFYLSFTNLSLNGQHINKRLIQQYIESDSGYINVNYFSASAQYDSAYTLLGEFKSALAEYKLSKNTTKNTENIASAELLYALAESRFIAWKHVNKNGSKEISEWKLAKLDSAIDIATNAHKLYLNKGFRTLDPEFYITLGVIHEYHNPQVAINNYKQALRSAKSINDKPSLARAHEYIGGLNYFGLSRNTATTHLKESFNLYLKLGNLSKVWQLGTRLGKLKESLLTKERLYYYVQSLNASRNLKRLNEAYYIYEDIAKLFADEIKPLNCPNAIAYLDSAITLCFQDEKLVDVGYSMLSRKALIQDKCNLPDEQYKSLIEIYNYGKLLKDSGYISKAALLLAEYFKAHQLIHPSYTDSAIFYYTISSNKCPQYTTFEMYDNGFLLEGLPVEYVDAVLMNSDSLAPIKYFTYKHKKHVHGELLKLFLNKQDYANSSISFHEFNLVIDTLINALFRNKTVYRDPLKVEKLTAEIQTQDNIIDIERNYQRKLKHLNMILGGLLVIIIFSFILNIRYFKKHKKALNEIHHAQSLAYKIELKNHEENLIRISLEHQIKILRLQINPHFIFNALNSIYNCILSKDNHTAALSLTKFSKLMRRTLESAEKTLCSLADEITTLELYVDLEKMRFDKEIHFKVDIASNVNPEIVLIPPLLIQPFIENCIWHGLMQSSRPGLIELTIRAEETLLLISIEDNGIGRDKTRLENRSKGHESVGVTLTTDRLRYFNEGFSIDTPLRIIDLFDNFGQPAGTRVELTLKMKNSFE